MIQALGTSTVTLLTNNPNQAEQLGRLGVTVAEVVPTRVHWTDANARYLTTKAVRGAHTFELAGAPQWAHPGTDRPVHTPDPDGVPGPWPPGSLTS